jgi:hypothetical protein
MKNDSSVSGEYNIYSTTESLSPYLEDFSGFKRVLPAETSDLSTKPSETGDIGDTEINQVLSILFCFSY